MEKKNRYLIKYCSGLGKDRIVEAVNESEAMKEGLALYRYNCTCVSLIPIERVVKSATIISEVPNE